MPEQPELSATLVALCATLPWFDALLLQALSGAPAPAVAGLLASELVVRAQDGAGYRLHDAAQAQAQDDLRSSLNVTQHRQIFEHLAERIAQTEAGSGNLGLEEACRHHMEQIFLDLASHNDLTGLRDLVAAARPQLGRSARLARWLDFYDGFADVRTYEYARGIPALERLAALADLELKLRIQVQNALGNAAMLRSQFEPALGYYREVQQLAASARDLFYQAVAQANIGIISIESGEYEQARAQFRESLGGFRALGDRHREAHALYHLGRAELQLGAWAAAQHAFGQAIPLHQELGLNSRLANVHWAQGFLLHMLGDSAGSERAYRQAQAQARSDGEPARMLAADCAYQLGFLYQTEARWSEALAAYDEALELARQLGSPTLIYQIQHRQGDVHQQQGRLASAHVAYAAAIDGIELLREGIHSDAIKLGLLGTVQQVYEAMVLLCLRMGRAAEAFEYVERARARALVDMLEAKNPDLRERFAQPFATLAETQAGLPAGALLVEYYTVGVLPRGDALINKLPAENARVRAHLALPPQTLIVLVGRDTLEVRNAPLDPNRLRPASGEPLPTQRLLEPALLDQLYRQLIVPVADQLAGRRLVYLAPHGPLHHVPFMALQAAGGRALIEPGGPAFALAPSATILLRNCLARSRGPVAAGLALGCNDAALTFAELEARQVARALGGAALCGETATPAELLAQAPGAGWLHIASHAEYDPHDPLASALLLGAGEQLSARAIVERLALRAELVTLSACSSGVGRVAPGDELLGLQRAFLYAGAPAVLCTLWEAADLVAPLLLDQFYAGLLRGEPAAAALRDAQLALRATTGRELLATLARWRAEDPAGAPEIASLPDMPDEWLDERLYDDPLHWAVFTLVGRGE